MNTCGGFLCHAEALKNHETKNKKNETQTKVRMVHEEKLCDTLQGMVPTYIMTVHQTSFLQIESNLDRLGLMSPMLQTTTNSARKANSLESRSKHF